MVVNNVIAAHMRQEKFSVGEIDDAIHSQRDSGCVSYEYSFAKLYIEEKIDMQTIKDNLTPEKLNTVKSIVATQGVANYNT